MSRTRKLTKIISLGGNGCPCVSRGFKLCVFTVILLLGVAQKPNMHNVALSKTCGMSSRYITTNEISGTCSEAINGNISTIFPDNPPNCIHTAVEDRSPFWWVNLGQKLTINTITIYGRQNSLNRMICVNVSLDGNIIKRFTDVNGWKNDKYDITVGGVGRVVNITRDCDNEGYTINICEVQRDGLSSQCDGCSFSNLSGICASCDTGFKPPLCKECADGWYGIDCTQTCGSCGGNSVCDKTTGICPSCKTRFNPPFCKECISGWYGNNCNETCGHCVGGNTTCDKTTGSCPLCDGVFQPPLCKDKACGNLYAYELLVKNTDRQTCFTDDAEDGNKEKYIACADGWYGNSCTQACGHCAGGSVCDKVNGTCTSCEPGFRLPRCDGNGILYTTSDKDKETVSLAGPVAGAAVGCSVAFFIIGVVTGLWLRRFRSQQPSSALRSPNDISMTREIGTSMPIPHSEGKSENASDYSNINVYDVLKHRDDDNTSSYTTLTVPPTQG